MARPAPGVDRTVALLTFLSKHPGRWFGLSELARRLGLNKTTIHPMVGALTDAGWLLRNPVDKSYRLGPGFFVLADAASALERTALELARSEMRRLADEIEAQVIVTKPVGDHLVCVATEGAASAGGLTPSIEPGARTPLRPPFGAVFVAWDSPDAIMRWLSRLGPEADDAQLEFYRQVLENIRERGYSVRLTPDRMITAGLSTLLVEAENGVGAATVERVTSVLAAMREGIAVTAEDLESEITESRSFQFALISAPVFDVTGRVFMAISVMATTERLKARRLHEYGKRLVELTSSLTAEIGGRLAD